MKTIVDFGTGGQTGADTSIVLANGNPAISYYNITEGNLMFARNSAADGSGTWTVATLDSTGDVGQGTVMTIVNGNPAIAYLDDTTLRIKYIRANDPSGTTWGAPVIIAAYGFDITRLRMAVVNGNPAVAYYDRDTGTIEYVRANDANGATWGTVLTLDTVGLFSSPSLVVVNGRPAISYYFQTTGDLRYIRASDANGTAWDAAVTVTSAGDVGPGSSMVVVNGNPAIAFLDNANIDLKYVRANDVNGATWGTVVTLATTGNVGIDATMQVVNGNPAVLYADTTAAVQDLKWIRSTDVNGAAWGAVVNVATTGNVGRDNSLVIAGGIPTVSYFDLGNAELKFRRANDANGATWAASTTPDAGSMSGQVGRFCSQTVVNGNPAIAYGDEINLSMKYVRATNAVGTAWGTPVMVDVSTDTGWYPSLAVVNGNPAIAYYDNLNADLKYVRATDADGTTWGTPITVVSSGSVGSYPELLVVNGNPAIAYRNSGAGSLIYVRATDANGAAWGTAIRIDVAGDNAYEPSMAIVNGNPAISYTALDLGDLKYARAADVNGASWGAPVTIDSVGFVGQQPSLVIVNGRPAISYFDNTNDDLKYVRASDINGTAWGAPMAVDTAGSVGNETSMAIVDGNPAISYADFGNLVVKYVRASNADGTAWGVPLVIDAGSFNDLVVANGNASICYYDATEKNLTSATIIPPPPLTAPVVSTPTSASIAATSATLGGNVVTDGGAAILERGVVYALTSANADPLIDGSGVVKVLAGGTTGIFTVNVAGLTASRGYSFKAYARNSVGTTYTTVATFSTLNTTPSNITLSNATIAENNPVNAVVGTLAAVDPDAGQTHTFAFAGGVDDGAFSIAGNMLTINGSADFEVKSSYAIRIRATDSGAGNPTFEKNFVVVILDVTLPQVINFGALGPKTFGDAPFSVNATGGPGLQPVTFSIGSGPATISGGIVTITGAGSVTVRASQAGAGDYLPAADVEQTFSVAQAAQSIVFAPPQTVYQPQTISLTATGGGSGNAVIFSLVSGPGALSGATLTFTAPGVVRVRAAQAGNQDYLAATDVEAAINVLAAGPPALDDVIKMTTGPGVLYPLANDGAPEANILSVSNPGVVINGRTLIVPADASGAFTYTNDQGRTAGVTIVREPILQGAARWEGLLYRTDGDIVGSMNIDRTVRGAFTGSIKTGALKIPLLFTMSGGAGTVASSLGAVAITEDANTGRMEILIGETASGSLRPCRLNTSLTVYHLALSGILPAEVPGGGYLKATLRTKGDVNIVGRLPDGRGFMGRQFLTDSETFAVYIPVSATGPKAFIAGECAVTNLARTDITGELLWSMPPQPSGLHRTGLETVLVGNGSVFDGSLPSGTATVTLSGGDLSQNIRAATAVSNGVVSPTPAALVWRVNPRQGSFRVSLALPGRPPGSIGTGLYLPKTDTAWGYFLGTSKGGCIELTTGARVR